MLLNQIRSQHNLTPFTASNALRNAARGHSSDMLQRGYFDHNSPTEAWDARIARYLKSPLVGEDIAWGQGSYGTPEGIVSQWMHSPTHRAIILTAGLHHIGLGLATGSYQGAQGRRHGHRRLLRLTPSRTEHRATTGPGSAPGPDSFSDPQAWIHRFACTPWARGSVSGALRARRRRRDASAGGRSAQRADR